MSLYFWFHRCFFLAVRRGVHTVLTLAFVFLATDRSAGCPAFSRRVRLSCRLLSSVCWYVTFSVAVVCTYIYIYMPTERERLPTCVAPPWRRIIRSDAPKTIDASIYASYPRSIRARIYLSALPSQPSLVILLFGLGTLIAFFIALMLYITVFMLFIR